MNARITLDYSVAGLQRQVPPVAIARYPGLDANRHAKTVLPLPTYLNNITVVSIFYKASSFLGMPVFYLVRL